MKKRLIVLFTIFFVNVLHCSAYAVDDLLDDECFDDFCDEGFVEIWDPLESINRSVFSFNDSFYRNILDPVSDAYSCVVPRAVRNTTGNLLHEVGMPIRFVSSLVQLDILGAIDEIGATLMNLTWGIIAPVWGYEMFELVKLETDAEDLGQSIGHWGVPSGPYIVWPFFGPSSLRESLGTLGGLYINPVSYVGDFEMQASIKSGNAVNEWSLAPSRYGFLVDGAIDPYISLKSSYFQNREMLIKK